MGKQELQSPAPQPAIGSSQIMLPLSIAGNAVNTAAPNLATVTPQPVIVNNQVFLVLKLFLQIMCNKNKYLFSMNMFLFQGFIVTSPQLPNNSEFIASLGSQYPPGTSFTIVPGKPEYNVPVRSKSSVLSHQSFIKGFCCFNFALKLDLRVCFALSFSWSAAAFSACNSSHSNTWCCPQASGATNQQQHCDVV